MQIFLTLVFGSLTAFFAYLAYCHTRERFRLDLFEKRWEIYEKTLKFCTAVMRHGGIPEHGDDEERNEEIIKALMDAHESFRGIGYHKTRALFGPEIHEKFDKLNKAYAPLVVPSQENEWINKRFESVTFILETVNGLPEIFKPYIYFGDYKMPRLNIAIYGSPISKCSKLSERKSATSRQGCGNE